MRYPIPAILLLSTLAASGAYAAGKITVDPNAARVVAPAKSGQQPDKRLDQKVTYDAGHQRLHAVLDNLSRATGVTIRCGKSGQDWQVRDIPVVVCVKEMPLGKLLQAIAAATHTELLAGETSLDAGKKSVVYRICRTRKGDEDLKKPLAAQEKAARELARWAWDALASLPPAPPTSGDPVKDQSPFDPIPADTRLTSRVFAALGPGTRDKLLGGEALTVRAKDVLPLALVKDIIARGSEKLGALADWYRPATVTETDVNRTTLSVKFVNLRDKSRLDDSLWLSVQGIPIEMKGPTKVGQPSSEWEFRKVDRPWQPEPIRSAKALSSIKGVKVAAPPDVDAMLKDEDATPGPGFAPLRAEADWKLPMLQTQVKVQLPKDRGLLNQSDVLIELAKSGGLNIVCEDFVSHKYRYRLLAGTELGGSVRDVFVKLGEKRGEMDKVRWFVNEDQRLLIGWANGWQQHHVDLAPGSIIDNIHAKCSGPGAELDDLVPIFRLTSGQFNEWVWEGRDLPQRMTNINGLEAGVWQVYDALSPEDKEAARSEAGLPLAKFDAAWIGGILSQSERQFREHTIRDRLDEDTPPEFRHRAEILSDLGFVANATMRVKSEPLDAWNTMSLMPGTAYLQNDFKTYRPGPGGSKKHFYTIELTGPRNGEATRMVSKWEFQPFPAYTPEKEAELRARNASAR